MIALRLKHLRLGLLRPDQRSHPQIDVGRQHIALPVERPHVLLVALLALAPYLPQSEYFLDASKAQGRIDKIMNDPKSPYWQGNKQAVFEMSLLFALVAQQR